MAQATDGRAVPTITDVARAAGVSKGLVSFVFNNRPGVAAATRDRILRTADELGWRPSLPARTLSTKKSYALGLVIRRDPSVLASDAFFPPFMAGVESVLTTRSRVLVLAVVPDAGSEETTYRTLAAERRVDGVFLTDLRRRDSRLGLLGELRLPVVTLGRPDVASPFTAVSMDDTAGIGQAVHHLAGLGHTRIAHVAGDRQMLHGRRRRAAFRATMADHGLDGGTIIDTDFSPAAGAAATRALLRRRNRPTAIVYANDPMAVAGLGAHGQAGLGVPEDVSVIGYDGTEMARYLHPALTTVHHRPHALGRTAARALLTVIDAGRIDDVDLPAARFVLGRSTASPPPASHSPYDSR